MKELKKQLKQQLNNATPNVYSKVLERIKQNSNSDSCVVNDFGFDDVINKNSVFKGGTAHKNNSDAGVAVNFRGKRIAIGSVFMVMIIAIAFLIPAFMGVFSTETELILKSGGSVFLDINPSIQFVVDKDRKVTKVNPLNEDAKIVCVSLSLKGKTVDVAFEEVIEEATKLGYIDVERRNNAVLISASLVEEEKENVLKQHLKDVAENKFKKEGIFGLAITDTKISDVKEQANFYGITEAKMNLVNTAKKLGVANFDPEKISISDLNELIEDKIEILEEYGFSEGLYERIDEINGDIENEVEKFCDAVDSIMDIIEELIEDCQDEEREEMLKQRILRLEESLEMLSDGETVKSIEKRFNAFAKIIGEISKADFGSEQIVLQFEQIEQKVSDFENRFEDIKMLSADYVSGNLGENMHRQDKNKHKNENHKKAKNFDRQYSDWYGENVSLYLDDFYAMREKWLIDK